MTAAAFDPETPNAVRPEEGALVSARGCGGKRAGMGRTLATVLLAAAAVTVAAAVGLRAPSASAAPETAKGAPAPAAVQSTANRPVTLGASPSEQPARAEESAPKEPEVVFRAGDYSGRTDENGKDADGMGLPAAGPGESLYIGYGELPHVGMTKVALVLSEDGQSVHDITVFLKGFDDRVNGGALAGISSIQTSNSKSFPLPAEDEPFGESTLKEIAVYGQWIFVDMDYSFQYYAMFEKDSQLVSLGELELWMQKAG